MADFAIKANKGVASVQSYMVVTAAASSPHRYKVNGYTIGCAATPGDNAFMHAVQRCTTAGTGSALTPNACDPAEAYAATTVAKDTITVDPTLTASAFLDATPLNQRTTFRYVSIPGKEITCPATASNGFAWILTSATTTSFDATLNFTEQ